MAIETLPLSDEERAELEALRAHRMQAETFREFVRRYAPRFWPVPRHLAPLYNLIERTRFERVFACVSMPPRHGKRLAHDTPILTPEGWRTHGDLAVGDDVFAPDGSVTKVSEVFADGACDLLITFDDGERFVTHGEHQWSVLRRGGKAEEVIDTNAMIESGLQARDGEKWRYRFSVRYTEPLQGVERSLPFDPYVLGYWLGNGTTGIAKVTAGPDDAPHVINQLSARGAMLGPRFVHSATRCVTQTIRNAPAWTDKRIPVEYLTASLAQRRALMAGLVDSDGHVERETGRVRYVTTLPDLARDVEVLVSSLGYRPSATTQAPHTGFAQGRDVIGRLDVHTVQWTPHDGEPPGTLERKRFAKVGVRRRRSIISIERTTPVPGKCIQVEHPDHLYLVGERLVPTHNSLTLMLALAWRIMLDPVSRNFYTSYGQSLSNDAGRSVRGMMQELGVPLDRSSSAIDSWSTTYGGGLRSTALGGPITGKGCNGGLIVVDDIIKGWKAARSKLTRDEAYNYIVNDVMSRLEGGSSIILVGTRWDEDDPIGRIIRDGLGKRKWEIINMPAIHDASGEPIDEQIYPELAMPLWDTIDEAHPNSPAAALEHYADIRARNEFTWWALMQGIPRSEATRLFGDPARFTMPLDWKGKRSVLWLDPAASAKTSADFGALGAFAGDGYGPKARMFINEIGKRRVSIPQITREALAWQKRYKLPLGVEAIGAFEAIPAIMRETEPDLDVIAQNSVIGDKFTRALGVSGAWNNGRVLVPMGIDANGHAIVTTDRYSWKNLDGSIQAVPVGGVEWVPDYIRVMKAFTGVDGGEDDVVDISAHAWNYLHGIGDDIARWEALSR